MVSSQSCSARSSHSPIASGTSPGPTVNASVRKVSVWTVKVPSARVGAPSTAVTTQRRQVRWARNGGRRSSWLACWTVSIARVLIAPRLRLFCQARPVMNPRLMSVQSGLPTASR